MGLSSAFPGARFLGDVNHHRIGRGRGAEMNKWIVVSQPENGDAECVWFLPARTRSGAQIEAENIAANRDESVILAEIIEVVKP